MGKFFTGLGNLFHQIILSSLDYPSSISSTTGPAALKGASLSGGMGFSERETFKRRCRRRPFLRISRLRLDASGVGEAPVWFGFTWLDCAAQASRLCSRK